MAELEPEYSIRRGRQHYAMNVEDTPHESVTAFHNYLVKNSPFNYMGFDYYLSAVPDNMSDSARIDVFAPMLDRGRNADKLWSGERIRYYEDIGIDDFDYDYEEEEKSPYIMQNPLLHDIGHDRKWGEHYEYDERFRDDHPEEMLKYDKRESEYINTPGAAYEWAWRERFRDLQNEMEDLEKLFGLERTIINRDPGRPWKRQEDSYGNQNIRPGEKVPRKITEQEDRDDDFSDEEIDKRKSYDSDDEMAEGDGIPFTTFETRILNTLHKYLTRSDLQSLTQETPPEYGELGKKFWDLMKMFGITPVNTEQDTRTSKYAKWALDNWTEEGDYGNIENPHKAPLGWYQVDREETGSQVEYKDGTTEILGFDEDDASERGDYNFWDWGGEMETNDYGDYEVYDSEITNAEFLRMDEGLARVLREDTNPLHDKFSDPLFLNMDKQKIQDLLFNYWRKFGPTLDPDKLKLLGFDMTSYDERAVVWDNLKEYYGDEELINIIQDRLEGLHDSWSYEYIVTNFKVEDVSFRPSYDITVDVLVNGDTQIPMTQESGGAIDMSLWDINENSAQEIGGNDYDDVYEEVRSTISDDISEVLLKDLPVDMNLDYLDISEPGTFEEFANQNEVKMITEDEDGELEDLVYIDEPREKHVKKMKKGLGNFEGFSIQEFMNIPPPSNESPTTEDEIEHIESIPVDKEFVDTTDDIDQHFKTFLEEKGLDYPKEELKSIMKGVKNIILKLKYHYNRPRPGQVAAQKKLNLNPTTLDSASTPSYPSGHATQGRFIGRYLADLYPEYSDELLKLGHDVGHGRLMAKVHYPSDQSFGIELGDALYEFTTRQNINEHKESKLNPDLMVGDEILVVAKRHSQAIPELYKPYVVTGIKHPNKYQPSNAQTYYYIEPIDMTDEYRLGAMLAGGGKRRDTLLYSGDNWILNPGFLRGELNEHENKEPGLNPELTYGDKILVIDIDREVESDTIKYNIPEPELRPEKFIPYTVVDKESNGHQSRWPFRYTLVLVDQLEEYEKSLDSGYGDYETYEKLLYPWIHQWIPADTPTATNVDRLTLNEHGADTSWSDDGDTVTLQDILELTKDITITDYPTKDLAPIVLGWEDNPEEIKRISQVEVSRQYPILIMVNEYNEIQWILDGNHRAQQALINDIETIPTKLIKPSDLDERTIKIFYPDGIPDTENLNKLGENLTEHKESIINPDLEPGDIIRVIEVKDEGRPNKPERWGVYKVRSKGVPPIVLANESVAPWYEIALLDDDVNSFDYVINRIYWGDTWIHTNVDRKTISESINENTSKISPDLDKGDIIRVIEIDGEHANMPDIWGVYKVHGISQDNATQELYYELSGETSEVVPDTTFSSTRLTNAKYLYHGDTWIPADAPMVTKVDRKTISEHNQPELSPELKVDDIVRVIDVDGEHVRMPERFGVYRVVGKGGFAKYDGSRSHYELLPYPEVEISYTFSLIDTLNIPARKTLYPEDTWIKMDNTIKEHKEEFNQPLTMGDIIRVVDIDKESTYEQPTYPYDTGNASGNSLMTNHHREQIHGQDTYPRPMRLYAVMSKSTYRPKDRDYLNPYWMLWPVDENYKIQSNVKKFREIILTEKDTWMTVKKHHSNIPGDIEAKQKEYDDSGRNFLLQPNIVEQVMMNKVDMLKSDIITFLTNRFILGSTDYSELKDNKGNYYRIIDMKDPYEHVTLSDLIEPAIEFVSSGIKSGDFEEEDMNTALTAITNWISLEMNQKKELVN